MEVVEAWGGAALAFLQAHPVLVLTLLFLVYRKYQASRPWPDFGGRVRSVASAAEWEQILEAAAASGQVVVVDAYATWCPPCKQCAPLFARMSETFDEKSCLFAKCNVDVATDLARALAIRSMPTFKIFKQKKEVESVSGFPGEARLQEMLVKHGAQLTKKK
ncbi:hypothetical protein AB1Y20_011116 [Prymnesium parvum]|uniref:Thioredoxin domain-containing protein n=1 Tax=Prymnesium parvum TaxID=97485 RepID=A0AB34INM6_PRYPA